MLVFGCVPLALFLHPDRWLLDAGILFSAPPLRYGVLRKGKGRGELDQFIKRELKCLGYVRYVDDFLLFAPDKFTLHGWRERVIEFAATLRQTLHEERAAVFPVATGIPFLGWRIYPDHRRLKRRNGIAFQRRFARLRQKYAEGKIERAELDAPINGWVAPAAHGDTWGLRRALLSRVVVPRSNGR